MVNIVGEFGCALMSVLMWTGTTYAVDVVCTASLSEIPLAKQPTGLFCGTWHELLSISSALKMEAVIVSSISVIYLTTSDSKHSHSYLKQQTNCLICRVDFSTILRDT